MITMLYELLDEAALQKGISDLHPDWKSTPTGLERIMDFDSFLTAVRFIDLLAPICEELDHHPDLALKWRRVELILITHSAKGVTRADLKLATRVDQVADQLPKANWKSNAK